MKKKIFLPMIAALIFSMGVVACNKPADESSKQPTTSSVPAKPKINVSAAGDKKQLEIDEEVQLSADQEGVAWKSSDEKIATVDASGKVKAVASGSVTITASKEGYQNGTISITVNKAPALATLHMEDADHYSADGWWASSSYGPGATPVYDRSSGNASDGKCIAYFGEGDKETLTFASDKAIKAELVVTMAASSAVEDLSAVENVKFNGAAISLAGKSFEGGSSSEFSEVSFGQVDIIAGDNVLLFEFLGSAPYLDDVLLYSKESATITPKPAPEKQQIQFTNAPENGYEVEEQSTITLAVNTTGVTFVSSDETKATVDNNGVVTGVAKGSVTITVKKDGMYANRATVKITEKIAAGEIRAEAENGTVNGAAPATADTDILIRSTSTGETCTAQWKAGAELAIKFNAANAGSYKLSLVGRAGGQYGMSDIEDLSAVISLKLNNANVTVPAIAITGRTFTAYEIGNVNLQAGENTIVVKALGEEDDKAPNIDFFKIVPNA